MRRLLSIVIILTYMAAAIGVSVSFHYCGGEFAGVQLTSVSDRGCCGDDGDDACGNCCRDKIVTASYKDQHTIAEPWTPMANYISAIAAPAVWNRYLSQVIHYAIPERFTHGPSPPLIRQIPIYLFIRVLRI